MCVLTSCAEVAYAQNQSPSNYGNITATASDCTATPAACVSLHFPYSNTGVVGIQVTGTWTATLAAQGSSDNGTTWFTVNMTPYTTSTPVSSTAANGNWQAFVGGLTDFRIRASAYTSGTAIVVLNSTSAVGTGSVSATGAGSMQVQGATAAGVADAGNPVKTGCLFETTPTTVTTGQDANVHCDAGGRQIIQGPDATGTATASLQGNPILIGGWNNTQLNRFVCAGSSAQCGFWNITSQADGLTTTSLIGVPYNPGNGSAVTGGLRVNVVGYNGSTLDTQRNASLANDTVSTTLTARNSIGAQLTEKGSRWTVIHNPAANSQATASIASEASVRHVVDCVSFSAGATTAPALTALTVNIRDGASGAGTIIWTYQVIIPAATGQSVAPHSICGLNLVGTTATAMTAEFSAGLTSLIESVSISGYNVN
jgi:hypothetical protein